MTWIHYALSAAALWGINYSVGERLIRSAGVPALLLANTVGGGASILAYLLYRGAIGPTVSALTRGDVVKMGICALMSAIAIICAQTAIGLKNATLAGMVEMTYPLFTGIFAYVLFSDMQLTPKALVGTALILAGAWVLSLSQ
jgi:hypothetical protein